MKTAYRAPGRMKADAMKAAPELFDPIAGRQRAQSMLDSTENFFKHKVRAELNGTRPAMRLPEMIAKAAMARAIEKLAKLPDTLMQKGIAGNAQKALSFIPGGAAGNLPARPGQIDAARRAVAPALSTGRLKKSPATEGIMSLGPTGQLPVNAQPVNIEDMRGILQQLASMR
jgi:hypothetical protein